MEETPLEPISSFSAPAKKKINKRFIYLFIAILLVIFIFLAFKLFGGSSETTNKTPLITPIEIPTDIPTDTPSAPSDTPEPKVTATPTPKPVADPVDEETGLDRSELSVTVENGSGVAGAAGEIADSLKSLGYSVTSTGNADNFDYSNVSIQVKSASSDYLTLLKSDLSADYTIGSTSSDLDDGFSSDALVIIGK